MLERTVGDLESSHAFADDVAVLVHHFRGLAKMVSPLMAWRRAMGLALQRKKTRLVRLQSSARLGPLDQTPQAGELATMEDGWREIQVAHEFKYLGYWVGPGASKEKTWAEARAKWLTRTRQLGATQVSPVVTMRAYKERCLPTLSYVAQVAPFPGDGKKDDLKAMATLFRTPYCAYPRALLHGLQELGLPHLQPAHLACEAAHTRYALQAECSGARSWFSSDEFEKSACPSRTPSAPLRSPAGARGRWCSSVTRLGSAATISAPVSPRGAARDRT